MDLVLHWLRFVPKPLTVRFYNCPHEQDKHPAVCKLSRTNSLQYICNCILTHAYPLSMIFWTNSTISGTYSLTLVSMSGGSTCTCVCVCTYGGRGTLTKWSFGCVQDTTQLASHSHWGSACPCDIPPPSGELGLGRYCGPAPQSHTCCPAMLKEQ